MFNVSRPRPGPDCSKDFRSLEVVAVLHTMFYGKCYLCESTGFEPVVEHFDPHESDENKKHDWDNLYYACHRCNNIKADEKELLDCADSSMNVSKAIKCLCPSIPNDNITVEAQDTLKKTKNTARLLDRCYNEDNTGIRSITRENLHEEIFKYYIKFIEYRRILKNRDSTQSEKTNAEEHLSNMTQDFYPFSIFWKWHIWSDSFLGSLFEGAV